MIEFCPLSNTKLQQVRHCAWCYCGNLSFCAEYVSFSHAQHVTVATIQMVWKHFWNWRIDCSKSDAMEFGLIEGKWDEYSMVSTAIKGVIKYFVIRGAWVKICCYYFLYGGELWTVLMRWCYENGGSNPDSYLRCIIVNGCNRKITLLVMSAIWLNAFSKITWFLGGEDWQKDMGR